MWAPATYDPTRARHEAGRSTLTQAIITRPISTFARALTWQISHAALRGRRRADSRPSARCQRAVRPPARPPAARLLSPAEVRAACPLRACFARMRLRYSIERKKCYTYRHFLHFLAGDMAIDAHALLHASTRSMALFGCCPCSPMYSVSCVLRERLREALCSL